MICTVSISRILGPAKRPLLSVCLSVAFLMLSSFAAKAQQIPDMVFSGQWKQHSSDAAACPAWIVGISHYGTIIFVTGSNGWSAVLETDRYGHAQFAKGSGRWPSRSARDDGVVHIRIGLTEGNLLMIMDIQQGDAAIATVRTTYERKGAKKKWVRASFP